MLFFFHLTLLSLPYFLYSFPCINPQVPCLLCSFDHYSLPYQSDFHITSLTKDSDCFPKTKSSNYTRKIFIMSSSSQITNPDKSLYDMVYNSIISAFEQENSESLSFLYGKIEFFLEDGDHYITNNISRGFKELFRRSLIEITINPSLISANIMLKTNMFHLFISSNFLIKNLVFYGNDIILQNSNTTDSCSNSSHPFCCEEAEFDGIYSESSSPCALRQRTITNPLDSKHFSLFNLEYIFDQMEFIPNFTIKN